MSPSAVFSVGYRRVVPRLVQAVLAAVMFSWAASVAVAAEPLAGSRELAGRPPREARILATKKSSVDGREYARVKYTADAERVHTRAFDANHTSIAERNRPAASRRIVADSLRRALNGSSDPDSVFNVRIALRADPPEDLAPPEYGSANDSTPEDARRGGVPAVTLNGAAVSEDALRAVDEQRLRRIRRLAFESRERIRNKLRTLAARHGWLALPSVQGAIVNGSPSFRIDLRRADIERLAASSNDVIAGIELYPMPQRDIASAMKSTRIDPDALTNSETRGAGIGIYMTELTCPDPGHISNYMRLQGKRDKHSDMVSAILRAVAPESYVYCRAGPVMPTPADLNGYGGNPRVHIVTRSNSSTDTPEYMSTDRDWDNFVYTNLVSDFNSVGNTGTGAAYVRSPAKALNVISIGNYDDATNRIAQRSSYRDPQTNNAKPELSLPGTNITAGGFTASGTSFSTPHAAAFAADLMSARPWYQLRPQLIKAAMLAGASKKIIGDPDRVGVGGADFRRTFYGGKGYWWSGTNASFAHFDAVDPLPRNGFVDVVQTLSAPMANVRAALVWLTRGSYTYDHRRDAHAIGSDLDLAVFDPNGKLVASSASFDNPFEVVSFAARVAGPYRFRIARASNPDTLSGVKMALRIDW